MTKKFLREKHIEYIKSLDKKQDELEYWLSEHLRMSGVYWGLTALDLMGAKDELSRDDMIKYVKSCQHPNGGFGANPLHDPHILYTLSAVQIMVIQDALEEIDCDKVVDYVVSLQDSETGAVRGDHNGDVIDTRFVYVAMNCLSLLDRLDRLDVDKAVEFINHCKNFDGGYGMVPGAESHSAQIFTCIGALTIAKRLDLVDRDMLCWWLCERQLPSGGLNGRPEKLPDVCYSQWVLSSLAMLDRLDWIDGPKLCEFILEAQDEESGGIADRKDDMADVFHTLFGIVGLSLLGYDGIEKVDPIHCMPVKVMDRLYAQRKK
ncbi:terpenoid cyclases/protein prenyltransferase alpha-alpha toroid [Dipodascopsis uninucleata]